MEKQDDVDKRMTLADDEAATDSDNLDGALEKCTENDDPEESDDDDDGCDDDECDNDDEEYDEEEDGYDEDDEEYDEEEDGYDEDDEEYDEEEDGCDEDDEEYDEEEDECDEDDEEDGEPDTNPTPVMEADELAAHYARLDTEFMEKVASGAALRLELGKGVPLDLVRIGDGPTSYYMGRFAVTQGQYELVMGENPSHYARTDRSFHPVEQVSWDDASSFCSKLNESLADSLDGLVFALPTLEQWEEAAYGGQDTCYAGGDELDEVGWYEENSGGHSYPVGLKKPNPLGLYDMSGNVWEWCLGGDGRLQTVRGGDWRIGCYGCNVFQMEYNISTLGERRAARGFRVVLRDPDLEAKIEKSVRGQLDSLCASFQGQVASGDVRRFDLGGSVPLDMVKVGGGRDSFFIGRFPVTQGQYELVTGENPSGFTGAGRDMHPVENVTYEGAVSFCKDLDERFAGEIGGFVFEIPTDEQWEVAALADKKTKYAGGNELNEVGWYDRNSHGHTHAVGLKKPNALGLYDMCGNVQEVCRRMNESDSGYCRGGGWSDDSMSCGCGEAGECSDDDSDNGRLGFRVVLQPLDWAELHGDLDGVAVQERHESLEGPFLEKVKAGEALRFDLGDGLRLDMVKIGSGPGAYYMGRFPVTCGQYDRVTGSDLSNFPCPGHSMHPAVISMTLKKAWGFCEKLTGLLKESLGGLVFEIPWFEQWMESACAGTLCRYAGDDDRVEVGWYEDNSYGHRHPVGMKKANAYGIHDMCGSVMEICYAGIYGDRDSIHMELKGGEHEDLEDDASYDNEEYYEGCNAGLRVVLQAPDWAARHARMEAESVVERQASIGKAVLEKAAAGRGRRFDLGGGVTLDLAAVGEGDGMFFMGVFPVTQSQYDLVKGENPSSYQGLHHDVCPVEGVSWRDARSFCRRLNRRFAEELGDWAFNLPTIEQWRQAASAGSQSAYAGGDDLFKVGWFNYNSLRRPHPAGMKAPNGYGLYDMSGNVLEWCLDAKDDSDEPVLAADVVKKMADCWALGGSWRNSADDAMTSGRELHSFSDAEDNIGFRVVLCRRESEE